MPNAKIVPASKTTAVRTQRTSRFAICAVVSSTASLLGAATGNGIVAEMSEANIAHVEISADAKSRTIACRLLYANLLCHLRNSSHLRASMIAAAWKLDTARSEA